MCVPHPINIMFACTCNIAIYMESAILHSTNISVFVELIVSFSARQPNQYGLHACSCRSRAYCRRYMNPPTYIVYFLLNFSLTITGREARVDHHGRTYYMDHSTRTIAYNGGSREDRGRTAAPRVSPSRQNPREIQTRREMLDRRSVHVNFIL